MKTWLVVLCLGFLIMRAQAQETISYEIDPIATAKASWKVGEKIVKEGNCEGGKYYREFLGITKTGLALMQDFYISGEKLSSPFLMRDTTTVEDMNESCLKGIEGSHTLLYKDGQKKAVGNLENGQVEGLVTVWYENGKKFVEGSIKNNKQVGKWQMWGDKGNLIGEEDFGTPED